MPATAGLSPVGINLASERLTQLVHALDAYEGVVSLQNLIGELQQCDLFARDMGAFGIYREDRYARNLIRGTPCYELYCMCWRRRQCSKIHDHGNSMCAVRVLKGFMTNIDFAQVRPGIASAVRSRVFTAGNTHGSDDGDIHQIGNLHPVADLMTLHIYSPPLGNIKLFQPA